MLDLFRPPKPPEVKPQDVSVTHVLMETTPRYHDTGRVEDIVKKLIRRREAEYRRRQKAKRK